MTKSPQDENSQKNKAGFIPYLFFIFFAVIFAVNVFYIYLSKTSWRGVATEDGYQKGVNYNQTLKYVEQQKKLGWRFEIQYLPLAKNLAKLQVCLRDKNNQLIKNAALYALMTRPTQDGFDFKQDFLLDGNCYEAKINFPLKGLWQLEIVARRDDAVWQEVKRYVVR